MTLDSLPDLDTSGLCLVETLSTALTCWPYRAQFVGRQTEDGLDTLPTRAAEADRSTLIADIPFPAPGNVAAKRCASEKRAFWRACRVPNPAKRLNVVQRPKTLFEPQRSMTSRS